MRSPPYNTHNFSQSVFCNPMENAEYRVRSLKDMAFLWMQPSKLYRNVLIVDTRSVYLAIDRVYSSGPCQGIGHIHTNQMLTLHPSELSSYVYADYKYSTGSDVLNEVKAIYYSTRAFNLADLQGPVPAAAYDGTFNERNCSIFMDMNSCHKARVDEVVDGAYNPIVSMPQMIKSMDPAFEKAFPFSMPKYYASFKDAPQERGIWDPPIVLTPTAALARPTIKGFETPGPKTAENQGQAMPGSVAMGAEPAKTQPPAAVVTIGDGTFAAVQLPGPGAGVVIGSRTLQVNGPAATVGGQVVQLKPEGVVFGGNTIQLPGVAALEQSDSRSVPSAMVYRVGGQAVTAIPQSVAPVSGGSGGRGAADNNAGNNSPESNNNGNSPNLNGNGKNPAAKPALVVGTATLQPGGTPVVVNGQTLSVGTDGVLSQSGSAVPRVSGTATQQSASGIGGTTNDIDDSVSSGRWSGTAQATASSGKKKSAASRRSTAWELGTVWCFSSVIAWVMVLA
jgi:hypothetical protein